VLESRERRLSVGQVASLCEHWELHNTSVCHHVCLHMCDFSMDEKLEQRANIKFCVKLGKSGAETSEMPCDVVFVLLRHVCVQLPILSSYHLYRAQVTKIKTFYRNM
jgi:hypothetical protein